MGKRLANQSILRNNKMKIIKITQRGITLEMVRDTFCSPEILTEVLRMGKNDAVSRYAAANLNCPPEVLAEVLRRGKNDLVSSDVAQNPNCPVEAVIKWKKEMGQIPI